MLGHRPALLQWAGVRPGDRRAAADEVRTGPNLAFVSYAADPARNLVIAMGVVDNLGKGAAGQAVQNANLMCGLPETTGLDGLPLWP